VLNRISPPLASGVDTKQLAADLRAGDDLYGAPKNQRRRCRRRFAVSGKRIGHRKRGGCAARLEPAGEMNALVGQPACNCAHSESRDLKSPRSRTRTLRKCPCCNLRLQRDFCVSIRP